MKKIFAILTLVLSANVHAETFQQLPVPCELTDVDYTYDGAVGAVKIQIMGWAISSQGITSSQIENYRKAVTDLSNCYSVTGPTPPACIKAAAALKEEVKARLYALKALGVCR